jgi:hypothetical protein
MDAGHRVLGRLAAAGAAVALTASCASGASSCPSVAPVAASCPDLRFAGHLYDEWHRVPAPRYLAEVGDATYPACNAAATCGGDRLEGLGSTDVWKIDGVSSDRAVLGLREGTHDTYVVFVRRGVDPSTLRGAGKPPGR